MKKDIDKEPHNREIKYSPETVKFINLVLVSDLLAIGPIFKSATNSGKLHKQSAWRASNPSLNSFLSSACQWSVPRRDSRSFLCD